MPHQIGVAFARETGFVGCGDLNVVCDSNSNSAW